MRHDRGHIPFLFCWGLFFIGCAAEDTSLPVYPVDGQLYYQGKPAEGAKVTFHANAAGATAGIEVAVRADGHFVAVQADGAIGLAEGDYKLTATWPKGERDRWEGEYADPAQPIAQINVKPSINFLPPIRLR